MPAGGGEGSKRIDVRAARTHAPEGVQISFQDSGVGISPNATTCADAKASNPLIIMNERTED